MHVKGRAHNGLKDLLKSHRVKYKIATVFHDEYGPEYDMDVIWT